MPEELAQPTPPAPFAGPHGELLKLNEAEKRYGMHVLEACGGRHNDAARVLGIGRTTLWRKLRELGVEQERRG